MESFDRRIFSELTAARAPGLLSIYLTTPRGGAATGRETLTRYSNLSRRAEHCLRDAGVKGIELQETLQYLKSLGDDGLFRQGKQAAIAVFIGSGFQRVFSLPVAAAESCSVAECFNVLPLLPLLDGDGKFLILAVSLNKVRLFEATRFSVSEISDERLPNNLREALNIDENEGSLQHHSIRGADIGGGSRGGAIYHSHGSGNDSARKSDEVLQYLRRVDAAVRQIVGTANIPMVFASVDYLFPMYREASDYREVVGEPLTGNPDDLRPETLHERAWPLVEERFQADRHRAWNRLQQVDSRLRGSTAHDILEAARIGRVENLFLADDQLHIVEGSPQLERQTAEPGKPECDLGVAALLNLAATEAINTGAKVFVMPSQEIATGSKLLAQFRFALEPGAETLSERAVKSIS